MMPTMPTIIPLFITLLLHCHPIAAATATSTDTPYFSKTLFTDYQSMLTTFKIYIYPTNLTGNLPPPLSLFYTTLLTSRFTTDEPTQATLFLLPFHRQSSRSLARVIQSIRTSHPYWDRSLGADHFYLTCHNMGPPPSRNVVELRKNAVQVSCFPAPAREFVPHKDITVPPIYSPSRVGDELNFNDVDSTRYLGYVVGYDSSSSLLELISQLRNDPEFFINDDVEEGMKKSKFCLFGYDDVEGLKRLGEALVHGCVPVVITDRPIQDLPLMDVIRWSEIVLLVGSQVEVDRFKGLLENIEIGEYEGMRSLGATAAHHLMWNVDEESSHEPQDAFHMVMYGLWLRRFAVRYVRWEGESATL